MDIKTKVNLHNKFDIEVVDAGTGELKQRAEAFNIVLNNMFARLCNFQAFFTDIYFGGGTGTLDPARTALFTNIGNKTVTLVEEIRDVANNIFYRKCKITLNPEEYVGSTITEVGIGGGGSLNTHALIRDSEGNQISIAKTSTDLVTIYATVYFQLGTDVTGKIIFSDLPSNNRLLNYLFGAAFTGGTSQSIGVGVGLEEPTPYMPSVEAIIGSSKTVTLSADVANKKVTTSTVRFGITEGNGDVQEVGLVNIARAKTPITGKWDGFDITGEALGTGDGAVTDFDFKHYFPKDGTIVIKKNGVAVPDTEYTLVKYNNGIKYELPPAPPVGPGNLHTSNTTQISLCFTLDGKYLIGATNYGVSGANTLAIFKRTGDGVFVEVNTIPLRDVFAYPNNNIKISPDGTHIVIPLANNKGLEVLKYENETLTRLDPAVTGLPTDISGLKATFGQAADGMFIAVYGKPSTNYAVKLYKRNGDTYTQVGTLALGTTAPYFAAMSPDASHILVRYYNAANPVYKRNVDNTFTQITTFPAVANTPDIIEFSPDSKYMAISSGNENGILWVYKRDGDTYTSVSLSAGVTNRGYCMSFSRDSKYLFITSGSGVGSNQTIGYMYKLNDTTAQQIPVIRPDYGPGGTTYACAVSGDAKYVIFCTGNYTYNLAIFRIVDYITKVKFNTAPASGDAITADYSVDYIPKDSNYVLDVSFLIQFGEGA